MEQDTPHKTYADGLRDGKIDALKESHAVLGDRVSTIEKIQQVQQRIVWGLVGAITLLQVAPSINTLLQAIK
jgi:hypothetical protein